MQAPKPPPDEPARLMRLHALKLLDTPAEERFDRYTRMARRLFDVPIALITLVDEDRQWFKSRQGLDVSETPRSVSFCGHGILEDQIFVVNDALLDERFCDNPLVVGPPGVRFYAGCPIPTGAGSALGMVCIIDRKPRHLSEDDLTLLGDLGAMVAAELVTTEMATVDELTGVSTRASFLALADRAVATALRKREPLTVLFFDLDHFKAINDDFGHNAGDRALAAMADGLRAAFRSSDIIGRVGGDEFGVVLPCASDIVAQRGLGALRERISEYNAGAADGLTLDYSVGVVALDPDRHTSIEEVLAEADRAMYRAKRRR